MEIERMFVLMLHVLCFVGAAIGIALAELAMFRGQQVDQGLLRMGSRLVMGTLCLLWLTGMGLIWIETGFDLALIAAKPKMVAKVSVVVLLSLNGYFLHRYFFDAMARPTVNLRKATNRAVAMAAVSGASWLYAGFLGLAKPLAPVLQLSGFAALYVALLAVSGVVVVSLFRPRVLSLYQRHLIP